MIDGDEKARSRESKIEGKIIFLEKDTDKPDDVPATRVGRPHDAVIHLVEYKLDDRRDFWFGTADIACSLEQLVLDARDAGLPDRPEDHGFDPGEFDYRIEFEDGRVGLATSKVSECEFGGIAEHVQVDFVGISPLNRRC